MRTTPPKTRAAAVVTVLMMCFSRTPAALASGALVASPALAMYGRPVSLECSSVPSGALTTLSVAADTSAGVPGLEATSGWTAVATAQATARGTITLVVTARRRAAYRLSWSVESSETSVPAEWSTPIAEVRVYPQLALAGATRRAVRSGFVAASPRMAPPGQGRDLAVQRYVGPGRWATIERVVPGRRWTFPAQGRGRAWWRVAWSGDGALEATAAAFMTLIRPKSGVSDVMRGQLSKGWHSGALDADRYRAAWADARAAELCLAALRRPGGARVLGEALDTLRVARRLARARRLTPHRAAALARQLAVNGRYFTSHGVPGTGKVKLRVRGSRLVWAYFPGRGIQFHPVDSLQLAKVYLRHKGWRRAAALTDELLSMQVTRRAASRRFMVSEYAFEYEGHSAPWISGMAEGLKLDVLGGLARGAPDGATARRYLDAANRTLPAFDVSWRQGGVADRDGHPGRWYLEYAYWDRDRVLNGFQFALLGLARFSADAVRAPSADARTRADSARARRLFELGVRELVRHLPEYDLGGWSRYSQASGPADPTYHWIHVRFLEEIARRTTNRSAAKVCLLYARRWGGGSATSRVVAPGLSVPSAVWWEDLFTREEMLP